jgi:hypothetical protein
MKLHILAKKNKVWFFLSKEFCKKKYATKDAETKEVTYLIEYH